MFDILAGLNRFAALESAERQAIAEAARVRRWRAKEELWREGDVPREMDIIVSGWAAQYKMLSDGRRQIVALLMPGDLWLFRLGEPGPLDHSVVALTPVTVARLPLWRMEQLAAAHESVRVLMTNAIAFAASIQEELTMSLGRRNGTERVGHLLCEIAFRLSSAGEECGAGFHVPLTQSELGDMVGVTAIHANRLLQGLRVAKLISLERRTLRVPDLPALERSCGFSASYLERAMCLPPPAPAKIAQVM